MLRVCLKMGCPKNQGSWKKIPIPYFQTGSTIHHFVHSSQPSVSPWYPRCIPIIGGYTTFLLIKCIICKYTHSYHFISCLSLHNVHQCLYICIYIYIHIPLYPIIWLYPSTSRCIRYPMISHVTAHYHIVPIKAPWKPHNALPHAGVNMTGPRLKDFHLLSSGQNPAVPASTYALCV